MTGLPVVGSPTLEQSLQRAQTPPQHRPTSSKLMSETLASARVGEIPPASARGTGVFLASLSAETAHLLGVVACSCPADFWTYEKLTFVVLWAEPMVTTCSFGSVPVRYDELLYREVRCWKT